MKKSGQVTAPVPVYILYGIIEWFLSISISLSLSLSLSLYLSIYLSIYLTAQVKGCWMIFP